MNELSVRVLKNLIGQTFVSYQKSVDNDELVLTQADGGYVKFYHERECCESVLIEDINGDLEDLIGSPIIKAEEVTNITDTFGIASDDSFTWTFYKIATKKGHVVIRWLGESNGYYSESVDIKYALSVKEMEA